MSSAPVRVRGGPGGGDVAAHGVRIVDTPAARVHHPGDLVGVVLAALAIAAVLVLAVYAQGTTTGLASDVQGIGSLVRRILGIPFAVLEGLITLIAPIAVLTELLMRRLVRQAFEAVGAAVVAIVVGLVSVWLMNRYGIEELRDSFSVRVDGEWEVTVPVLLSGTAALITAAGSRGRRRTVGWSWNLLWVGLGVALITGLITLPGALLTVLLGRITGLAARYVSGVESERAYGSALVDGVRRAGFDPTSLIRVRDIAAEHPEGVSGLAGDLAAVALTRHGDNRVYAMTDADGRRLDVVVFDGDRQVVGMLTRFWRSLRLRGIDGRAVVSLRQAAERAALLSYAASAAGVSTPRLLGMAESEDSMLLIQEHPAGVTPLADLPAGELTDEVLDAVWDELRAAHSSGLAHRALTADAVLVDVRDPDAPRAMLTGWDQGDVASSELARRLDISHLLALLALRVGADRAVASASRDLPDSELTAIGPLLQTIALPRATREESRSHKGVLAELREALLERIPEADVQPERLIRFGARTVLMIALTIVAAVVVITTISFPEIAEAFTSAEPWWAAVAFGLGLVTFIGSALALVAFAPVRLSLWRTTLVQTAAAFVSLVAPAGVGPAALNLRMLVRRGVANPLAVASVGLVQVSQFLTTLALLLVLSLLSGSQSALRMPSRTVLVVIALIAIAAASTLLIPPVRAWVAARTVPLWRQTWPRLVRMLGQPKRFAVAIIGNLIMTIGYLGAFYACLAAFGRELSLIDLALIYLVGNATGALVPSPGGLGPVELALIGGLTTTGNVPGAIATSVVVLFRALTFWARIPLGWVAMRNLQKTGEL